MNEYAKIVHWIILPIKIILHVAMLFRLLSVISGSTSYLSRKGGFCCWPDFPSLSFNICHSWNHAKVREHFKFNNDESSLDKCQKQAAFWERIGTEIQYMIVLKSEKKHTHFHGEYCYDLRNRSKNMNYINKYNNMCMYYVSFLLNTILNFVLKHKGGSI